MVSYQKHDEDSWDGLQFEHIDWNDIAEAEFSGDSDALSLLRKKSEEMKRIEKTYTLRSYAEVVSPLQHGTKRSISERAGLSPVEYYPKRNVRSRVDVQRFNVKQTPPSCTGYGFNNDENTPEKVTPDCSFKSSSGAVQRRLFPSPNTGQFPPARSSNSSSPEQEALTPHRLSQRQKQIDFGKNTIGYQKYIQTVPRWERKPTDPVTPDKHKAASTRAWQGQIRVWRRALHKFDPPTKQEDTFTPMEASLCEM